MKLHHASLNAPVRETPQETLATPIPGGTTTDEAVLRQAETATAFLSLLPPLVLNLKDHLTGQARNPARISYFRLFFMDNAVQILHTGSRDRRYFRHARDLFAALKTSPARQVSLPFARFPIPEAWQPLNNAANQVTLS